jgi:hypothetical protein
MSLHVDYLLECILTAFALQIVPPEVLSSLTAAWYSSDYKEVDKAVNEVMNAGFSAEQIVSQVRLSSCCGIALVDFTYSSLRNGSSCMTTL